MRNLALELLRAGLALLIIPVMPMAHLRWGEECPGGGPSGFAFIFVFIATGIIAAIAFGVVGSIGQYLLRRRAPSATIALDLMLFAAIACGLVYLGTTAEYVETS